MATKLNMETLMGLDRCASKTIDLLLSANVPQTGEKMRRVLSSATALTELQSALDGLCDHLRALRAVEFEVKS
jgi:hypothetical protein